MIKINLLGQPNTTRSSDQIAVAIYCVSLISTLLLAFGLSFMWSLEIEELETQKTSKQQVLKRWQEKTTEVKDLEKKQADLEDRLARIAMLNLNKQGPVKVMDAINNSIPERSWLTEVKEQSGMIRLQGLALDGETVSQFIRNLEEKEFFSEIKEVSTEQIIREGVKIQKFQLSSSLSYAGKVSAPVVAEQPNTKQKSSR